MPSTINFGDPSGDGGQGTFWPPPPPREKQTSGQLTAPAGYTPVGDALLPLYPRGDMSTGWPILTALGSYWSRRFEDRGTLLGLYRASSVVFAQTYTNYLEAVACTSRLSCPILHRRPWYALVLSENAMEYGPDSLLKYGADAFYNGSYRYGVPVQGEFHSADPGEIKRIGVLMNRIMVPTLTWVTGTDFYITDDTLYLRKNPFEDGRLPVNSILDERGEVIDREVLLWAFSTYEDWDYLYQHYGYVIRRQLESSGSYHGLINSILNGVVGGLSIKDFEWAVAAIAGLPTVLETTETVENILDYGHKTVIVTNYNAYIYPTGSIASVAAGDKVYAGQCLVDTVSVFDLANFDDIVAMLKAVRITDAGERVARPASENSSSSGTSGKKVYLAHRSPSKIKPSEDYMPLLHALPVSPGMLGADYQGSLLFNNMDGRVNTDETDDDNIVIGKITRVDGAEADVARFWSTAHANGVAEGATWLTKLGKIPAYVNPAGWVIEHFLRNNAIVVYLRYTRFSAEVLGLDLLELLRQVLPPEKMAIFMIDIDVEDVNAWNYETPICPAVDSSSSAAECAAVTIISQAYATHDAVVQSSEAEYGSSSSSAALGGGDGYAWDLEPIVFYPSECD